MTESIKGIIKFYTDGQAYLEDEEQNFIEDLPGVFAHWCQLEPEE
jgi:hypothetical protein